MTKKIKIIYSCDSKGNHDCAKEDITSSRIKTFTDKMDAIHFIAECTVCTHNVKDVHPDLFYCDLRQLRSVLAVWQYVFCGSRRYRL